MFVHHQRLAQLETLVFMGCFYLCHRYWYEHSPLAAVQVCLCSQAELDTQAEKISQMESLGKQTRMEAQQLELNRKTIEQRLVQADKQVSHLQHELQCTEQRDQVCKRDLMALQQDYERAQVRIVATIRFTSLPC